MTKESLKEIWSLSYPQRKIRPIGVLLLWQRKPAAYELNDGNGFILTDVVIAAMIGFLCLVPAAKLASQSIFTYTQAQNTVGAAIVGRRAMEELRSRQGVYKGESVRIWNDMSYTVLTRTEYTGSRYIKYFVEVKDEKGIVRQYVSLSAAEQRL